jgi:hypothetical protein
MAELLSFKLKIVVVAVASVDIDVEVEVEFEENVGGLFCSLLIPVSFDFLFK